MQLRRGTRSIVRACSLLLCGALATSLLAAEPTVRNIDLRGLQIGATTTITVDGTDLTAQPRLLLPFVATQKLKDGATPARAVFEVTLAENVVPGLYNLRIATDEGVSSPLIIGVDRLPQMPVTQEVKSLPVALHGTVVGSAQAHVSFSGKAGQEITIEVEAGRLGSKLRPVIHLYDEHHLQRGWSWPTSSLAGDCRLIAKLPQDGNYQVQVHDVEYAAAAGSHFRLKIGAWDFAEQAFPPVVSKGPTSAVELLGSGPAVRIEVTPTTSAWMALNLPDAKVVSGMRPRVGVSPMPEIVEDAQGVTAIQACPLGVSGRLTTAGEEDRFQLAVTPGSKLRFEIFADRYGSPLDAVLLVRNDKGQQLARGEDSPGSVDPVLEFVVPDKTESLMLAVADLHGRGGPRCIYRLTIESLSPEVLVPSFDLKLAADRVRVARDGRCVVPLLAERRGYMGPIQCVLDGLPSGLTLDSVEVPEKCEGALLTISGSGEGLAQAVVQIRGSSSDGQLTRVASFADHPLAALQPWLAEEVAVAAVAATGFSADWGEFPSDAMLPLGAGQMLPIKVVRPAGQAGPVRLSLLTSQDPPKANGRPDLNRTLRVEAAVEIAADKNDGQVKVIVPATLTSPGYDLALHAELLSADKKNVLMSAYTPVRRLNTFTPLVLELAETRFEATLDPKAGAMVKIPGKIVRKAELKTDVTITATSLPAGIRVAPLLVKGDSVDFELPVVFPGTTKPGEYAGIKLSASAVPDPRVPQGVLKTEVQEVVVVLMAAD